MDARRAVLLTPLKSFHRDQLPFYKHLKPGSPLFATLTKHPQIITNTATLSPFIATYTDIASVSPVFATHTKTPGVYTNNSHFGSPDQQWELRFSRSFLHAGRITKTVRSRRRNDAKKSSI